jgi:hypothetical protein
MNAENVASYQADATTKRPRPVFTCEMAKAIKAPILLSDGERSPKFFYWIIDQLEVWVRASNGKAMKRCDFIVLLSGTAMT